MVFTCPRGTHEGMNYYFCWTICNLQLWSTLIFIPHVLLCSQTKVKGRCKIRTNGKVVPKKKERHYKTFKGMVMSDDTHTNGLNWEEMGFEKELKVLKNAEAVNFVDLIMESSNLKIFATWLIKLTDKIMNEMGCDDVGMFVANCWGLLLIVHSVV